jgi:hypothetical protein
MQDEKTGVKPNHFMHSIAYHQSAAMHAAQMVRMQYTRESKNLFRRECLAHLKASLLHGGVDA